MEWSSLVVKIPGVGQALETSRDPEEEPDRDRKNPSYGRNVAVDDLEVLKLLTALWSANVKQANASRCIQHL